MSCKNAPSARSPVLRTTECAERFKRERLWQTIENGVPLKVVWFAQQPTMLSTTEKPTDARCAHRTRSGSERRNRAKLLADKDCRMSCGTTYSIHPLGKIVAGLQSSS